MYSGCYLLFGTLYNVVLYMSIIASCYKVLVDMAVNVLKIKMFEKITHGPSL